MGHKHRHHQRRLPLHRHSGLHPQRPVPPPGRDDCPPRCQLGRRCPALCKFSRL